MTALAALMAGLASCGVDGEPVRPSVSANIGVGSSGVTTNVGVGVRAGFMSVFLGL
jgi:hypothetical protein